MARQSSQYAPPTSRSQRLVRSVVVTRAFRDWCGVCLYGIRVWEAIALLMHHKRPPKIGYCHPIPRAFVARRRVLTA